jgi:hypothetical protein
MVVYICIYVAQWACSTMYMGTTAVHGLSVLCNLKVHGNYSVLFWMCLSNSETIQPAEALQFSMYRLCVAFLWKIVCVCQCVTTHKLSLICFVCRYVTDWASCVLRIAQKSVSVMQSGIIGLSKNSFRLIAKVVMKTMVSGLWHCTSWWIRLI